MMVARMATGRKNEEMQFFFRAVAIAQTMRRNILLGNAGRGGGGTGGNTQGGQLVKQCKYN